jgi:hypothetical protein
MALLMLWSKSTWVPSGHRPQFLSSDNLAALLDERNQQLEGALLEPDAGTIPAQLAAADIHCKSGEFTSLDRTRLGREDHGLTQTRRTKSLAHDVSAGGPGDCAGEVLRLQGHRR